MTLNDLYQVIFTQLIQAEVPDADVDAFRLLEFVTGINHALFLADKEQEVSQRLADQALQLASQRAQRIPLQHLIGEQEFMGLSFRVNKHVLIPRQDTEVLVESALRLATAQPEGQACPDSGHVLDIGCGSGCILISFLHEINKGRSVSCRWHGVGIDVSPKALQTASENARRLHTSSELQWICSDLFNELDDQIFDLILSNPPYIPTEVIQTLQPEVKNHDPITALDGGADGLSFYHRLIPDSRTYLKQNGWLLVEIGYDQAQAVTRIFESCGYRNVNVKKDFAGCDRVVAGQK